MAILNGVKVGVVVKSTTLRNITFTGTVTLSSVGVSRKILCYKKGFNEIVSETTSDSSGDWTLSVVGGSNDEFRIICVGNTGENSEIFEHVAG
jgi:hypothetical protein